MKNKVEILLLDKNYLNKQMKDLPGLSGVAGKEEGLTGVPFKEEEEEYCSKCGRSLVKEKHKEPDVDDAGGQSDDDEDNDEYEEKQFPKKLQISLVKRLVNKLFGGANTRLASFSPLYSEMNDISIITIEGEIGKRTNEPGKVDVDEIAKAIKIASIADTKACILHISSPGGSSTGVAECGDVIKKLTETKPVFTYCDTICASAAYWLASCTNGIYCTPSSELSSIGVYAKVVDYSESLKMQGINMQIFSAGEMKTMGQPDVPLTEKEAKYIQDDVNEQWEKFKSLVVENRGNVNEEHMQGQLMSAEKAVEANLADEIVSDMESVIEKINQ